MCRCPMSLLSQWQDEALIHTKIPRDRVLVYYGTEKLSDLSSFDIILTTYGLLRTELETATSSHSFQGRSPLNISPNIQIGICTRYSSGVSFSTRHTQSSPQKRRFAYHLLLQPIVPFIQSLTEPEFIFVV